jgi:hypothetical protein
MGGDSACLELSRDRGDWDNVKGREAYVSVCVLIILSVHAPDIGIRDSAFSADTVRLKFEPRSSQNMEHWKQIFVPFMFHSYFVICRDYSRSRSRKLCDWFGKYIRSSRLSFELMMFSAKYRSIIDIKIHYKDNNYNPL